MALIVILILVALLAFYFVSIFNSLIQLKNLVDEAWSGIDVQLKRRYDLIPNIINTVKGYASHEKEVLEGVIEKRNAGINAHSVKEHGAAEGALSQSLGRLFALAESYPALKANENFLDLQNQLQLIESDIQNARRYYNGTVRDYSTKIEQFPSNIVANIAHHTQRDFFELENVSDRINPKVDFS
ncbi:MULTISPECIES: LemA family protein [Rhodonellum]|uniref:LemA protein n=1 Tax=Rhodonellum ikkaensis TaxID=336829 RepID=A0A1H3T7S7_9BACT|nr:MULTISPECIES: LemA family protein [Rhodonellum]SDZ46264.1 LemA protein [Rhodonellum ikkaensis]